MKKCSDCRFRQHPEWAVLIPGFMICINPKAGELGRLDLQRVSKGDEFCGPEGKWWENQDGE